MRTLAETKAAFSPITKLDEGQKMRLLKLEKAFINMVEDVFDLVEECPDRTAALRKLLEAKQALSQAVTHFGTMEEKSGSKKKA